MHILTGDALTVLKTLEPDRFQCVVTSPPYYALRNYGVDGQIGLEDSVDAYIAALVAVFDAVARVMRDDGVCWVNIADSYAGFGKGYGNKNKPNPGTVRDTLKKAHIPGIPAKSRIGIPERFVLAMLKAGWLYRQEIIWHKNNPILSLCGTGPQPHMKRFLCSRAGPNISATWPRWQSRVCTLAGRKNLVNCPSGSRPSARMTRNTETGMKCGAGPV